MAVPSILLRLCTLLDASHQVIGTRSGARTDHCLRPGYHAHVHRSGKRRLLGTVLVEVLGKARVDKVRIDPHQGGVLLVLSAPTEELVCGLLDGHDGASIVKLQPPFLRISSCPGTTTTA